MVEKKEGRKEGRICEKKEEKRNWYCKTCTSRRVYTLSIWLKVVCRLKKTPIEVACVASVSNRVITRKLERKQKKGWRGRGKGEDSFFPLPLPRHSIFFLLLSQLSRRTSRGNACYAGYDRRKKINKSNVNVNEFDVTTKTRTITIG